ncbi:MAG: amidohydrolase [Actinobacteria bacterium]|nr:amidohydrolase [Actinomycetota bacterium]
MTYKPADLLLHNARVITLDENNPLAEFVAVKGNKIITAGRKSDIESLTGPDTKLIDCQGRAVIPGFNDAHCHPIGQAITLLHIDCSAFSVKSIADIKAGIRKRAQQTPGGQWLRAAQYDEFHLTEKRHPTRWELDEAAPGHPVILVHYSAGICVLNSMALRLVGITRETPDSAGGRISRDRLSGEPDGIIFGRNEKVQKGIPPVSGQELEQGIKLASRQYLSCGITSLQDTGWTNSLRHWQTYRRLKIQEGLLPNRISMLIGHDALKDILDNGLSMGSGDNQLRIGGVKLALDERSGNSRPPQEDINRCALMAHQKGFQIAFHVHDQYNLQASLTAIEFILRRIPNPYHRHRLEHCMVCTPDLLELMKRIRPVVVTQPSFLHFGGENFMETVPPDKFNCLFPFRSFYAAGLQVAFSSDSPMNPGNPLIGIYTASTRREANGRALAPEEGIPPMAALRMYTLGGAYVSYEEDIKGSIAPGKLADLAVLDKDPNQVDTQEIKQITAMMTIIDGKVVWEK